jgi:hypothetical protein
MNTMLNKVKAAANPLLAAMMITGFIGLPSSATARESALSATADETAWSFGIISDTQWTVADDGYNPNTVAANIIKQIDQQFINAGVKLVIAVGDTVNEGDKVNIDTRALYAQDLYNAGIGFYPLRGNHEANEGTDRLTSGPEFRYAFPQIETGINNTTPTTITTAIITTTDLLNNPPAVKTGTTFTVGTGFTEPTAVNTANNSVSYAFQYNNATFMLLDQFDVNGDYYNSTIPQQQQWISDTLSGRPANTHAFVFVHKNLLGGNHKDNMFGGQITTTDPGDGFGVITSTLSITDQATLATKQAAENDFIGSMQTNNVYYVISGHDHHHYVSVVTSPNGQNKVHQLITQSDSSKFYTPGAPVSANDASVQQDLGRVGYYIFTVKGTRVTVDYYGDVTGASDYGLNGATFRFVKLSSTTYNLNGTEKLVAQKGSYTTLTDDTTKATGMGSGFMGTSMSILAGKNNGIGTTNYSKPISNVVTTGWTAVSGTSLASDMLTLNGMSRSFGSEKTDEYVLSMSYVPTATSASQVLSGTFGIMTRDSSGRWYTAVAKNFAINQKFVVGPYNSSYTLGARGVDTATHTAWAVLNYNGDFAVGTPSLILPLIYHN